MGIKTVRISFTSGFKRVWGLVDGNLAITPYFDGDERLRKGYTITHIPTGAAFNRYPLRKKEALSALGDVRKKEWHGQKIVDMPACELLELAPIISQEAFGKPLRDEHLEDREALSKLLRCKE